MKKVIILIVIIALIAVGFIGVQAYLKVKQVKAQVQVADELYAEFPNASFFRPEPRRNLILSFDATF